MNATSKSELTRPNFFAGIEVQRIRIIDKNMLRGVPPTETHVESTHKCDGLIDNTHFLMLPRAVRSWGGELKGVSYVSPIESPGLEVTGGTLYHDIFPV